MCIYYETFYIETCLAAYKVKLVCKHFNTFAYPDYTLIRTYSTHIVFQHLTAVLEGEVIF